MKRLLFASGDIGGARALIPIAQRACRDGLGVTVVRNGYIGSELNPPWEWLSLEGTRPGCFRTAIATARPDALIFAGSVKDDIALSLAREAKAASIVVVFVLDGWSDYRGRLISGGNPMFVPDAYTVPDQLALTGAKDDGLPASILQITGQPAFEGPGWYTVPTHFPGSGQRGTRRRLLFVSEPVEADHGKIRGYTEHDALALLCTSLAPMADSVRLEILPHPRHKKGVMEEVWEQTRGRMNGDVITIDIGGGALTLYDGIVGMASVLLYQGWLLGRPVLSVQPNLQLDSLRQLGQRANVVLVDRPEGAADQIRDWTNAILPGQPIQLRPEAALHRKAAESILSLTLDLAAGVNFRNKTS